MAGIQSLGIGSSNNLNMKTIKELRKVDEEIILKPVQLSIDKYEQKIKSLDGFFQLLQDVKSDTSSIKDDFIYLQRTANVIGDGVSAVVEDGVDPQNITIKVEKLATEHVIQSDSFTSKTASVATEDSQLIIKISGIEYSFEIKAGMQLNDLVGEINEKANKSVSASILQTGTKEFRLVLRAKESGADNKIELIQGTKETIKPETSTQTITTALPIEVDPLTGATLPQKYKSEDIEVVENVKVPSTKLNVELYNEIQKPENAQFTFNEAEVTRSSNKIDDMILGLTFTLEEVTEENKRVNIVIDQNTNEIIKNLQSFVDHYNLLMAEVDTMTKYDPDVNEVGIFLGESSINSVRTNINYILRQTGANGESIANAGLSLDKDGKLTFDLVTFKKALIEDPHAMQELLQGTKETKNGRDLQKDGLFYKLNETLDDFVNSSNGSITNFERSLESQLKRTRKEKEAAISRLDDRYEAMKNQFTAANAAIGKMEKGFSAVDMQIKQSQASK